MSWVTCPCASIILSRSFWWLGPRAGSLGAPCLRSQVLGLAWGCSSPGQGWGRGCLPSLWSASCAQSPSRRKQVLTSLDSQVGCERCTCPFSFCSARLDSWQGSLLTEVPPEVEEETVIESWLRAWYPQLPETHTKCFPGLQNTFYFLYWTSCSEGFQNRHWGPFFLMFIYLFIWLHQVFIEAHWIFIMACGLFSCGIWDLILWPGIEPGPLALGAQRLSHWTTGEVPTVKTISFFLI